MTETDAYKVLGASRSVAQSRAERLYRQKRAQLRLQIVPGMPLATRQKAQAQLAELETAWQVLQVSRPARARRPTKKKPKPAARKAATPSRTPRRPYPKPQTLGEAWEQVASMMPFSEPVTAIILILGLLATIMALLRR